MNADRIASSYRWLEYAAFGLALEKARCDFLLHATAAPRVLILGEGDGRFLARLLRCNRNACVAVIESSGRMMQLARSRVAPGDRSRVEFHQIDAVARPLPTGPFDCVVSHFFLDTLNCRDAESVIGKVSAQLSPGASWLLSEFQEPPGGVRRLHARLWLAAMYSFFSMTTGLRASRLPPYRKMLERRGLVEVDYRERRFGLIRSQVWAKRSDGHKLTRPRAFAAVSRLPVKKARLIWLVLLAASAWPATDTVQWVQFQDPFEHAFTVDVPKGWTAKGGLFRLGTLTPVP
jgi:SAM-dependent methyltransferase